MRETSAHDGDEVAIRAVEATYDNAWCNGDIDALGRCFARDAVLVNPFGQTASGHGEIVRVLGELLKGPGKESEHSSLVDRVQFISSDVAVVDGVARLKLSGEASPLVHRFSDVMVRQEGVWLLAHVHACPPSASQ
jgi:uncharacterized protein (TIGR02246 family)